MPLKNIKLPERYNYIACFISLSCNYKCDYCINWFGEDLDEEKKHMSGEKWVEGLNRLICPENLPVTLQGGEPGVHPDFIKIVKNIKPELNIDILTNLSFDVDLFIKEIDPARMRRDAPYPSIRVSYHPQYSNLKTLFKKTLKMQEAGFSIGIHGILHPDIKHHILESQKQGQDLGIDFRTKEFLGEHNGKLFGTYFYPDAVCSNTMKKCLCRTSELIIGNLGKIFRCHHDAYKNFPPTGHILDPDLTIDDSFLECNVYGDCNACDIKVKTNRFQKFGYTAVEIKDIEDVKHSKETTKTGAVIG